MNIHKGLEISESKKYQSLRNILLQAITSLCGWQGNY